MRRNLLMLSCALMLCCSICSGCNRDGNSAAKAANDSTVNAENGNSANDNGRTVPANDTITFAFAGDVMLGSTYPTVRLAANDGADILKDVADIFRSVDVAAANLEGVLLDEKGDPKPIVGSDRYTFKMPTRYVKHLTDVGMDFMSIANNHVNDFGAPGLESTQKVLKEAELPYAGIKGKCPSVIIERGGRKIGLTAFGFSKNCQSINDYDEVRRVIGDLRDKCDIIVVSFHGGGEGKSYTHVPHQTEIYLGGSRGNVEEFAHVAIDAGADIVYGHSPHVTRALELYKDRLIMYSLGNFATPYGMNLTGINSHAPLVTVKATGDGKFIEGKIHPFIQVPGVGPRTDRSGAVINNMRTLTRQDFPNTPLNIADDGTLTPKK